MNSKSETTKDRLRLTSSCCCIVVISSLVFTPSWYFTGSFVSHPSDVYSGKAPWISQMINARTIFFACVSWANTWWVIRWLSATLDGCADYWYKRARPRWFRKQPATLGDTNLDGTQVKFFNIWPMVRQIDDNDAIKIGGDSGRQVHLTQK